jgi:hypothetical protein
MLTSAAIAGSAEAPTAIPVMAIVSRAFLSTVVRFLRRSTRWERGAGTPQRVIAYARPILRRTRKKQAFNGKSGDRR